MLVLSRRKDETLLIGEDIAVKVIRIGPNSVRLGIEAPRGTSIIREEIGPYVKPIETEDEGGEGRTA